MDNKPSVSEKDRRLISFFLSFIVLSGIFSFMGDISDEIMTTSTTLNGMVSDYTSDSVYVFIDWTIEYEHNRKFTETDLLEVKLYVNKMMSNSLKYQINSITYENYQNISKDKLVMSKNGITITFFNNLNN